MDQETSAALDSLFKPDAPAESVEQSPSATVQQPEKPVETAPAAEKDLFSSKFAALSRKERELVAKEKQFKAQKAELERMRQELESKKSPEVDYVSEFKKNPIKWAEKNGITYDQLIQMGLNEGQPTAEMQMQQMREELQREMESKYGDLAKKLEEKEKAEAEARVDAQKNGFISEIKGFIDENSDKFELIKVNNAVNDVFELIEEYYKQTFDPELGEGQIMSIEEAANKVEAYYEAEAEKLFNAKKLRSKFAKPSEEVEKIAPTLSNTVTSEVPLQVQNQMLSRDQEIQEAAKLLRFMS